MIILQVDEAYAFDYLSILEVKKNLHPSLEKLNSFLNCKMFLTDQLNNFNEIYQSKEYQNLYDINKKTFDLVDLVRRNSLEVTAKQVDEANMERFYKKQILQKVFFNRGLIEEKIV
jgi:hypothetical protein